LKSAYYEEQWQTLKEAPKPQLIESLSKRIASNFIDRYYYSDEYNREHIHLLCEMATYFDDEELNQITAKALFGSIIERLCDDFEELQTETYNRLICQVVNFLCKLPEGVKIESELYDFQLRTEEQLYQRIESIRLTPDQKLPSIIQPKKVIILSRVTIGADVAITSVICQRIAQSYPDAQIIVIGNDKLKQVFAEGSDIYVHELAYSRRGGLLEKFQVWLELLAQVRALIKAQLTNQWMDNILGNKAFCYPKVWTSSSHQQIAAAYRAAVDLDEAATLITINLGVGGNKRKRVPGNFEKNLILTLLKEDNIKLILDLGFGEEERAQGTALLQAAKEAGIKTAETTFSQLQKVNAASRVVGVECNIGEITSLIGKSDEFIGYDSACQHIAAAESVKTFTIFAGTNNVRFIRRWQACGENSNEIIYVDTLTKDSDIDTENIIATLMDFRASGN